MVMSNVPLPSSPKSDPHMKYFLMTRNAHELAVLESLDSGKVPADELLDRYHGDWNGDLTPIYREYSY